MITVVLESGKFNINRDVDKIKSLYPKSSTLKVGDKDYSSKLKVAEHVPLLTDQWFVIISPKVPINVIKKFDDLECVCLIQFRSKDRCEAFCSKLDKEDIKFNFLDCIKFTRAELENYTMEQLDIDRPTASYLCSRCKYSASILSNNIYMLQTLDVVDKKAIRDYVDNMAEVNFHYLVLALLGYRWRYATKYKACVKLLAQYRFGSKRVSQIILDEIKDIEQVYTDVYSGDLTMETVTTYTGVKSRYILDYIRLSEQVSFDYIIYVRQCIERLYVKDALFSIRLIGILKLSQDII